MDWQVSVVQLSESGVKVMAGNVVKPQLVIPTQYAPQQQSIAQKRKLAEAMLSQGLANDPNMNNWTQVLGKLAQAWAGKSMDKEATKMEGTLNQTIYDDYNKRRGDFNTQTSGMSPQQVVQTFGADPMLADDVKPYRDAMARALTEREDLRDFGGRVGVRTGDVMGQVNNDPNKDVLIGPDGQMMINPVKATSNALSSGSLVLEGPPATSAPMPGAERLTTAMAGQQPTQQPSAMTEPLTFQAVEGALKTLGPQGAVGLLQRNGNTVRVNSPEEAMQLPKGTKLILPDGTEGVVP